MSVEVVKKTEITKFRGRQKYARIYEAWFSQALRLNDGEALKIVLTRKSSKSLPSLAAIRFAIERWNRDNPDRRIGKVWRNVHFDEPILYLFPEKGEEKPCKKSKEA